MKNLLDTTWMRDAQLNAWRDNQARMRAICDGGKVAIEYMDGCPISKMTKLADGTYKTEPYGLIKHTPPKAKRGKK